MTPHQRGLARHALGLVGDRKHSYRNSYACGPSDDDHDEWLMMVAAGEAVRIDGKQLWFGGDDLFHLTRQGAQAALQPGETLDLSDFPAEAA